MLFKGLNIHVQKRFKNILTDSNFLLSVRVENRDHGRSLRVQVRVKLGVGRQTTRGLGSLGLVS